MCSTLGRGSKKKATLKLGQQICIPIYKTYKAKYSVPIFFFPSNEMSFEDDCCILTSFAYHKKLQSFQSLEFVYIVNALQMSGNFRRFSDPRILEVLEVMTFDLWGYVDWNFAKIKKFSSFNFCRCSETSRKSIIILTCKALRVVRLTVDCTVSCCNFLWVLQPHFSHSLYENWMKKGGTSVASNYVV